MATRLTKTFAAALKPPAKGYVIHWDPDLAGFGLRVTAAGARSFVLQDRINGRERRITIGRFPGVTPEIARRQAQKLLGQIASGGDPVAERARQRLQTITLEQAFEEYIASHHRKDGKPLKDLTKRDMRRAIEESFADWKRRPVTGITRDMVKHRYAERARTSVARANIAMRYLRAVLNFAAAAYRDAEGRPVLTDNPVRVLSEAGLWRGVAARSRVMSEADLAVWLPAVMALGETPGRPKGQGKRKPRLRNGEAFRDLFLFLALTGARKSEALGLRRSDVDLQQGTLRFLDTKNRTDHLLPLAPYVRALLERRMQSHQGERVFAGSDGVPVTNLRYALERIATDSGVKFSPHDLRRLAATALERAGVPVYTVKSVLNHLPGAGDVTGRYVRVDAAMQLAALEKLEVFVLRRRGKVVELRRPG